MQKEWGVARGKEKKKKKELGRCLQDIYCVTKIGSNMCCEVVK